MDAVLGPAQSAWDQMGNVTVINSVTTLVTAVTTYKILAATQVSDIFYMVHLVHLFLLSYGKANAVSVCMVTVCVCISLAGSSPTLTTPSPTPSLCE